MQTYIFIVAVNGEDVQDVAEKLRDQVIDLGETAHKDSNAVDVQVTQSLRVTP